ncbi:hypothetical protein Clacol_004419 [Clathrus columnatus]|uniref:Uncharacterized protein n=1 Tax=Clathrus columnatus TaxID=1419009 RepID=A0AAV5AAI1_9AGAM|nr:hypothetical protein Clacol_004419 [Clathrus columnatus]
MSSPTGQSEAMEIINEIEALEAEIKELRRELDRNRAVVPVQRLPPYILIERDHSDSILVSRKVLIESCRSRLAFYSRITDAIELPTTHSEVDERTGEVVRYRPMKVLARLDYGVESALVSDWYGIGGSDESFLGVVEVATRLKVKLK